MTCCTRKPLYLRAKQRRIAVNDEINNQNRLDDVLEKLKKIREKVESGDLKQWIPEKNRKTFQKV